MLRRRRITAQIKKLPEPAQVQETMASIQHAIITGKYTEDEVRNGDESGMFFGAPPKYQFVPIDADRATAPEGDEKCA